MFCRDVLTWFILFLWVLGGTLSTSSRVAACPFCSAVSQTLSEEINSMDVVVIASLVSPPNKSSTNSGNDEEVPKAEFKIEYIIKGEDLVDGKKTVETIFFGEATKGQYFLIMGVDPPNIMWSTPLQLSERSRDYVSKLTALPESGADRLVFFQSHLEDEDEMLARDAYDEFAKAPYSEVKDLEERMNHDRLIEWIKSTDVPASRRRLYLTMLGVCGQPGDLPLLEEMLKSTDRKTKAGLDAMIACYLTLKGPDGMPLVEDLFLKDTKAEYADTYAAIMALRFHGTEAELIPRQRLLHGLRFMLERPQLADLVIPDLAKWEDWSVMERLVQLFKDADEKSSWVRVPVINYLRACPEPDAKKYIKELEKIDPEAVRRAHTFFPFGSSDETEKSSQAVRPGKTMVVSHIERSVARDVLVPTAKHGDGQLAVAQLASTNPEPAVHDPDGLERSTLNPFRVLGVGILAAMGLLWLQWSVLRGAGGSPYR